MMTMTFGRAGAAHAVVATSADKNRLASGCIGWRPSTSTRIEGGTVDRREVAHWENPT